MKGCLLRLTLLPVMVAAMWVLLSLREPWPTFVFPAEGAEVASPVAGFLLWFAVLFLLDARKVDADRRLARRALERGIRDGERLVAWGTLEAAGPLLEAPFSGEECVGYHYTITHRNPQMKGTQTDAHGFALAPCAITGPLGSLKVLAACNAELFHEVSASQLPTDEAYDRADRFLKATDFGAPSGLLGDVARKEIIKGPGDFRHDVLAGDGPKDLRASDLSEKILRPGDEVHAVGVFVESARGIAPDPDDIMRPFHLTPGGEAALQRTGRNKRIGAVVCAGLSLAVVAVYLLVFVQGSP